SAALGTMQELLDTTNEPEPDSRLPKQHAPFGSRARGVKNPAWLVWREFHRLRHPKSRFSRRGVPRGADSYVIPAAPVGAEEALGAVLSVWIAYEMIRETLFTNDGVPLTYTLADALLTLRKAETNGHSGRPIAESTKQTVGQRLRDELGVFMLHAVDTIRAEEAARAERKALLRKPIEPHVKPFSERSTREPEKGQPQRNEPTGHSFAHFLATEGA